MDLFHTAYATDDPDSPVYGDVIVHWGNEDPATCDECLWVEDRFGGHYYDEEYFMWEQTQGGNDE